MSRRYNTPHRTHVVKTCMNDEEYDDFKERLSTYGMSQSEFIRQAITRTTIRPVIQVSPMKRQRAKERKYRQRERCHALEPLEPL